MPALDRTGEVPTSSPPSLSRPLTATGVATVKVASTPTHTATLLLLAAAAAAAVVVVVVVVVVTLVAPATASGVKESISPVRPTLAWSASSSVLPTTHRSSTLVSTSRKYDDIPVEASGHDVPEPVLTFTNPPLDPHLIQNIEMARYKIPTPVQKYSIPIVMGGRDLMACAQTGSGKTGGFLFPILSQAFINRTLCHPGRPGWWRYGRQRKAYPHLSHPRPDP